MLMIIIISLNKCYFIDNSMGKSSLFQDNNFNLSKTFSFE